MCFGGQKKSKPGGSVAEIYKVQDYMDKTFLTLSAETDVYNAIDLLLDTGQTSAVVCDDNRKIVGILSEKDCLKLLTGGSYYQLPGGKVKDYMTSDVFCVPAYTDIFELADMFLKHYFRRIVVKARSRGAIYYVLLKNYICVKKKTIKSHQLCKMVLN